MVFNSAEAASCQGQVPLLGGGWSHVDADLLVSQGLHVLMAGRLTLWAHSPHGAKRGASFAEVPVVTSEACFEANTSKAMRVSSPVSEPDPGIG